MLQFDAILGILIPMISVALSIVIMVVLIKQSREKARVRALNAVKRMLIDSAALSGVHEYEPVIDSPMWKIGTLYRTFMISKSLKDPTNELDHIVKSDFPAKFSKEEEKVLIGFGQLLLNQSEGAIRKTGSTVSLHEKHLYFLGRWTFTIQVAMNSGEFTVEDSNHINKMKYWRLSEIVFKQQQRLSVNQGDFKRLEEIFVELDSKPNYHAEHLPYLAGVVHRYTAGMHLSNYEPFHHIFSKLTYDFKILIIKELRTISDNRSLIDACVRTISLKPILEKDQALWAGFIDDFEKMGYRNREIPFDMTGLDEEIEYQKRYEMAIFLISFERPMKNLIGKLLTISDDERESFFDYNIPEEVSDFCYDEGLDKFPFLKYNRRSFLDTIRNYQQGNRGGLDLIRYIEGLPEEIITKIRGDPGTQSILRYTMGNILVERLRSRNYDIGPVLTLYGPPYDNIIDIVGANISTTILSGGNDKKLQDCLLSLQSALIETGGSKKKIKEVGDWVKLWASVNEKTRDAKETYEYPAKLLDVIEDTKGEFEPLYIAQQALNLIGPDLEKAIRIFRNIDLKNFNQRKYQDSVENAQKRLESVKHAYYKLLLLSKNQSLQLSDEIRKSMVKIAEELLAFVIKNRREDFMERIPHFPLDFGAVLEPGALVKSAVTGATFVYLPPAYHTFPLPALRVLDEFLAQPERIPYAGVKAHGIIVYPGYWLFAIAVGLTLQPMIAYAEQTYSNFFVPEYLKTAALAFKKGEASIEKLLRRVIPDFENLDSSNLLVTLFKQLADQHYFQGVITREYIIDALKFGGWDVSLADKIIEEKDYCVFCSFALPDDATKCPNCEREVQKFDLSTITPDDIELDLEALGLGGAKGPGDLDTSKEG